MPQTGALVIHAFKSIWRFRDWRARQDRREYHVEIEIQQSTFKLNVHIHTCTHTNIHTYLHTHNYTTAFDVYILLRAQTLLKKTKTPSHHSNTHTISSKSIPTMSPLEHAHGDFEEHAQGVTTQNATIWQQADHVCGAAKYQDVTTSRSRVQYCDPHQTGKQPHEESRFKHLDSHLTLI